MNTSAKQVCQNREKENCIAFICFFFVCVGYRWLPQQRPCKYLWCGWFVHITPKIVLGKIVPQGMQKIQVLFFLRLRLDCVCPQSKVMSCHYLFENCNTTSLNQVLTNVEFGSELNAIQYRRQDVRTWNGESKRLGTRSHHIARAPLC